MLRALGGVVFVWALVGLVGLAAAVVPVQVECGLAAVVGVVVPGYALVARMGIDRELQPATTLAVLPLAGIVAWAPFATLGFFVGLPFTLVAGLVWTATGVLIGLGRVVELPSRGELAGILAGGMAAALLGARWQAMLMGDALFHAGVVDKILAVDRLSLGDVWQFRNGHPQAGYALPLLHVVQAGIVWATRLDPSTAYNEMSPAFAFLIPVAAYALGSAVAGKAGGMATAVLAAWNAMSAEGFISYAQQPRYVVTFVILPVFLALLVHALSGTGRPVKMLIAVMVLLTAVLHITYAPPLLLMLAVVSVFYSNLRSTLVWSVACCGTFAVWVYAVSIYGGEKLGPQPVSPVNFVIVRGHRVALSGFELFNGQPEYVIAALLALVFVVWARGTPLGLLALCTVVMLALTAVPGPLILVEGFTGPGQALRYAQEVPWVYLLGPALVVLARQRALAVAFLIVVSVAIAKSHLVIDHWATPISLTVGLLGLATVILALTWRSGWEPRTLRMGSVKWVVPLLVAVLAGPLLSHGRALAHEAIHGKPTGYLTNEPTVGAIAFLRAHDDTTPVVLAPYTPSSGCWYTGVAYELVGNASVYAVAISSFHTEADPLDAPRQRRLVVDRYLDPATSTPTRDAIVRRYHVNYVVIDLKQAPTQLVADLGADPLLVRVYRDPPTSDEYARFAIYGVRQGT